MLSYNKKNGNFIIARNNFHQQKPQRFSEFKPTLHNQQDIPTSKFPLSDKEVTTDLEKTAFSKTDHPGQSTWR